MDSSEKLRANKIIRLLRREYPEAKTQLEFNSIFELLVAVVLSAQSTDVQVNRVTEDLFSKYNTPEQLAQVDLPELENLIRGVGLYKNKAKSIINLSRMILAKFHGNVPDNFDSLMELPGVGRKTANVMLSVGFNQPGLGVDTHVHRVSNRLGLVKSKNPDETEKAIKSLIPRNQWSEAHHLLIFHGRRTCLARHPKCEQCSVNKHCPRIM